MRSSVHSSYFAPAIPKTMLEGGNFGFNNFKYLITVLIPYTHTHKHADVHRDRDRQRERNRACVLVEPIALTLELGLGENGFLTSKNFHSLEILQHGTGDVSPVLAKTSPVFFKLN